jgi:hypothetical protein
MPLQPSIRQSTRCVINSAFDSITSVSEDAWQDDDPSFPSFAPPSHANGHISIAVGAHSPVRFFRQKVVRDREAEASRLYGNTRHRSPLLF